jgi:serine/threonine-protein phosphatase 2B catalytic subunit
MCNRSTIGDNILINISTLAITSFEEARRSDIENERLPPTRQAKDAQQKEETDSKIRDAVEEDDQNLHEIADAIMSEADPISS